MSKSNPIHVYPSVLINPAFQLFESEFRYPGAFVIVLGGGFAISMDAINDPFIRATPVSVHRAATHPIEGVTLVA